MKRLKLFLSFSFLFLSHCSIQQSYDSVLLYPSVGEETALPDSNYFYFDLDESHYDRLGVEPPLYEMSTTLSYGDAEERNSVSNCEIKFDPEYDDDPESSFTENKICILDIMEHDLVVNNLKITYNIPEGMCRYVHITPPWHYNYPTGRGPSEIYECEYESSSADDDGDNDKENYFCASKESDTYNDGARGVSLPDDYTCNGSDIAGQTRTDPKVDTDKCAPEIQDLCVYNHLSLNGDEVSCCYGEYENKSDASVGEWGDSGFEQCLGGPGKTSWEHISSKGFPNTLVQPVSEFGVRGYFDVKNLLEVIGRSLWSTPVANYLKILDQDPEDLREIARTEENDEIPAFLKSQGLIPPSPFFEVKCIDSAGEVLHQLQLMVREWNTHEEFLSFYQAGGTEDADPDVGGYDRTRGIEGEDCDYEQRSTFKSEDEACNDSWDLDDFFEDKAIKYPRAPYDGSGGEAASGTSGSGS